MTEHSNLTHQPRAMQATTVSGLLFESAASFPDHDLLVVPQWLQRQWNLPKASWSYRESAGIVRALAERYRQAGYGAGQRIALLFENRPDHFFHWLALNSLGISIVPLNPDYQPDETRYALEHSESVLVVTAVEKREQVAPVAAMLSLRQASGDLDPLSPAPPRSRDAPVGAAAEC